MLKGVLLGGVEAEELGQDRWDTKFRLGDGLFDQGSGAPWYRGKGVSAVSLHEVFESIGRAGNMTLGCFKVAMVSRELTQVA